MKKNLKLQLLMSILMLLALATSVFLKPTHLISNDRGTIDLESIVPKTIGKWRFVSTQENQIVNPAQDATIKRIYTQTLSRVYVNDQNQTIMLTIAYGRDQSDSTELHRPDVCYPAQGFRIESKFRERVENKYASIMVERLLARTNVRIEPVTYWTVIGNKIVLGGLDTKLEKIKYGIKNNIPDGLLIRISNIVNDPTEVSTAYLVQNDFVFDFLSNLDTENRNWFAGLL